MKLFYCSVIVAAGIVITCLGMGTIMALGIFLQPMSAATGWSRTSISTAALLNFLCMGPASFLWGALYDRFGTRVVALSGGVLLGLGLVAASQAGSVGQFQILFGVIIGVAAGSFYAPLTATATHWFTRHRSLSVALISAAFRPPPPLVSFCLASSNHILDGRQKNNLRTLQLHEARTFTDDETAA